MLRPVPEFIAAVIPITRGSRRHSATRASPNTCVYWGGGDAPPDAEPDEALAGAPVGMGLGLAAGPLSLPSRPPPPAGGEPLPLALGPGPTARRPPASAP